MRSSSKSLLLMQVIKTLLLFIFLDKRLPLLCKICQRPSDGSKVANKTMVISTKEVAVKVIGAELLPAFSFPFPQTPLIIRFVEGIRFGVLY